MKKEVKELIDNRDINRLKYIFVDALDVDPTFDNYIEMFNYCKENKLIPNIYHTKEPYLMMCYDSFKRKINKKEPFLLFTYKIDGEV